MFLKSAENCHVKFTPLSTAENTEREEMSCQSGSGQTHDATGVNYYHIDDFSWEMALSLSEITISSALEKSDDESLEPMRAFLSWFNSMTESTREMSALEADGFYKALRTVHWVTSSNKSHDIDPVIIRDIGFIIQVLEKNAGGFSFVLDLAELGEGEKISGMARMYEYGVKPS